MEEKGGNMTNQSLYVPPRVVAVPYTEDKGQNTKVKHKKLVSSITKTQKKATRTFFVLVCVFIIMYLPTGVTMLYMNTCRDSCDCFTVHVMRDISTLTILSSSLFRPLNFIFTLTHIKDGVLKISIIKYCLKIKS